MKRKVIALLLCMTSVLAFAGCGNGKTEDTQATEIAKEEYNGPSSSEIDIDLKKQVSKLCDYKGIEVTIAGDYEVTDEKVENNIMSILPYYGITGVEVKDRDTVQEGDYVKIDYTGYADGEAFEGGSAEDVMFDVSNNFDVTSQSNYIDGFADGLMGAKVGEEASSDVTFPENYQSTELAGKPATFKFKIKGIYKPVTMDNLTDDMVKEAFTQEKLTTKDELIDYVKDYLKQQCESARLQDTNSAVKDYVKEHSEVEVPEDYLQARLAEYEANFIQDYCSDSQTLEQYAATNGTTVEEMRTTWKSALEEQIIYEFLFGRIADLEDIQVDEEDYGNFLDYLVSAKGDGATEADVYQYYGNGNEEDGEKVLRQLYRVNKAVTFVSENAKVTEKKAEAQTEQ
ncbi:MAG: FKBP-type peptidyl-prolyl cis-trans isomerase [Lachnospiraceae bacterium]|nr:FKBP-type peptidyl-prolyl cis-trans isomerase [Lachnospiraceae bacterium]